MDIFLIISIGIVVSLGITYATIWMHEKSTSKNWWDDIELEYPDAVRHSLTADRNLGFFGLMEPIDVEETLETLEDGEEFPGPFHNGVMPIERVFNENKPYRK